MIPVLVSQRVDVHPDRDERRDALDQRMMTMLASCGLLGIAVPNVAPLVEQLWDSIGPRGVILTGGNDVVEYGGDAPERDATERALLDLAVRNRTPVLGICRGLQLIICYFGGRLAKVPGHVATRHQLTGSWGEFVTNSYHRLAPSTLPAELQPLMFTDDRVIEAVRHRSLPITAVMWHPEREPTLAAHDHQVIVECFGQQAKTNEPVPV